MSGTDICLIVCTYNRSHLLQSTLESLINQETDGKFSFDILVIDDASTDDTPHVVKEVSKRSQVFVRYVLEEGKGIARARNRGIKESASKWIAFFDDDMVAQPNWLKELFTVASELGVYCIGGAVPLLLPETYPGLSPICRPMLGERMLSNQVIKCPRNYFPTTSNVLLEKRVFEKAGILDGSLTRGGEDIELGSRIRRAGFEGWFAPQAVVHHIIPPYRLEDGYLLWTALRSGDNFAYRDYKEWGLGKTLITCVARIGQGLLINAPLLIWSYFTRNRAEVLGRKCLLWRAVGYVRQTLFLLAPRLFSQEDHFARLEFRRERVTFVKVGE